MNETSGTACVAAGEESSASSPEDDGRSRGEPGPSPEPPAYDRAFFWGYCANGLMTTTNALLSRYVEFVRVHEPVHTEWQLGMIVGFGMIGALLMRMSLGGAIDRYGAGRMWRWCGLAAFLTCAAHLLLTRVDDGWVFLVRVAYQTSLAGVSGASLVYVSRRGSPERMAEIIGTLGTSGFLGMLAGPVLGDAIFGLDLPLADRVRLMFFAASSLAFASWLCSFGAVRGEAPTPAPATGESMLALLKKHQPGAIMLVGVLFGVALILTFSFFADFARQSGLGGIGWFFTVYSISAFVTRLAVRRFPERYGIPPMIYVGLAALAAGNAALPFVARTWELWLPAALFGVSHAFVFPAVVAGGSAGFPERSRGVATALMLLTLDVGMTVGAPLVGATLSQAKLAGWAPYPTVYFGAAASTLAVMGVYAWSRRRAAKPAPRVAAA